MIEALGSHGRPSLNLGEGFAGDIRKDEPLSRHTTYRIGGPARYFVTVSNLSSLSLTLAACAELDMPWTIIGQGSNLLVADEGYDGVVIRLSGEFGDWSYDEERHCFVVGCAAGLSRIVQEALHRSLTGLEFAVGTPGTIGGALRMNAGSRSEWIGRQVVSVTAYAPTEGLKRYHGDDLAWGYRRSSFPPQEILVECELWTQPGEARFIRAKMEGALARRKKTQPLNQPSCGSVFRNPPDQRAGQLIEQAGLKGRRIGGAQISEKHGNFIVNVDHATAADVMELIRLARDEVRERYGIELQPEVRFLGFA